MNTPPGVLHTVNKSPFASASLESCLRHLSEGASLLLIEDGVYAALTGSAFSERLATAARQHALYVLGPDLEARGLAGRPLVDGLQIVDYQDFVRLAAEHATVHAWF
ncbi:MAG TPA: sulfurtransferase complex subunit TusB [Telmatospirillum sp.]|nr:sulfurtransferase complex subunit TusB [Telmatospirillum sp.]